MTRLRLTDEEALARVAAYRGGRMTSKAVVAFTQAAVRDALPSAPQPVGRSWISYSTSTVGRLARTCEEQGLPLDRAVVFERSRIDRFLSHDCKHMTVRGRASYRSTLDCVAAALLHGENESPWPRATLSEANSVTPWDDAQAARVAQWTSGLRPRTRQDRTRVLLALALGAGLRRRDMGVTGQHVRQDEHGVHLSVPVGGGERRSVTGSAPVDRVVTVAAAWEKEVLLAAERAGSNLLVAPTRQSMQLDCLTGMVIKANGFAPAGDEFTLTRARNTWLVRHLAAGTPLPLLMKQAGLSTPAVLTDLLPYVPTVSPTLAAAFMRGV